MTNTPSREYVTASSVAMESPAVRRYAATQTGSRLLAKLGISSLGIWRVECEGDENGRGREMGFFKGTLRDVIEVVSLDPNFYSYGSGGEITLIIPKVVAAETAREKVVLRNRILAVEEELVALRKKESGL